MKQQEYPTNTARTRAGKGIPGEKKGQSLIEVAVVAPVLLLLVFGIVDLARLMQAQASVTNAARRAVRYAVTGQQERVGGTWITRTDTIRQKAIEGLNGLILSNTQNPSDFGFYAVDLNPTNAGAPGQVVEVYVYYNVQMLTPMVNMILPRVLVRGYERSINEEWGPVQTFDHANLPPTPLPLPTWTPFWTATPTATRTPSVTATRSATTVPTQTRTSTATASATGAATNTTTPTGVPGTPTTTPTAGGPPTQTPTLTLVPTVTRTYTVAPTNTRTATPTRTLVPTVTPTVTQTPASRLTIQQIVAKKPDGTNQPLNIRVKVVDQTGANVNNATVSASAGGGGGSWSGGLPSIGNGLYQICFVGSFDGNNGGGVTVNVTATRANTAPDSGSAGATIGTVGRCP